MPATSVSPGRFAADAVSWAHKMQLIAICIGNPKNE